MKRLLFIILVLKTLDASAQDSAGQTAKTFIRQGDYNNAILVLNRAIENDRSNTELKKDLAFAYYMQRDYTKAMATIRPVAESRDADVQSFQILGLVYKATEDRKEAERMYRSALRKFPDSGVLYNEYGEIFWSRQEYPSAISQWQE